MTLLDEQRLTPNGRTEADALIEEARQRQRKRRLWIGSIALVVVVAAGAWAASGGIPGNKPPSSANKSGHIKAPSGAPGSDTHSGRLTARTSQVGQVVISADGRTMTAWAGVDCGHAQRLRAHSYSNRVTLTLVTPVVPPTTLCLLDLMAETVSTRLPAPLGERRLVQASSGKPIPYFDASQFARLTVLPPGCVLAGDFPAGGPHNRGDQRDCTYGSDSTGLTLSVTQFIGRVGANPGTAWSVVDHPSINGHRATLWVGAESGLGVYVRSVAWHQDGYTFVLTSEPNDVRERVISVRLLLAIADGLHP